MLKSKLNGGNFINAINIWPVHWSSIGLDNQLE